MLTAFCLTTSAQMIYCQVCCEPFHSFCLWPEERPQEENKENWCCRRCKFCHVCGRKSKNNKVCGCGQEDLRLSSLVGFFSPPLSHFKRTITSFSLCCSARGVRTATTPPVWDPPTQSPSTVTCPG